MKAVVNGKLVLPDAVLEHKTLLFEDQVVGLCDDPHLEGVEVIDAQGAYVVPGLIDLHIHGYLGEDASDGRASGVRTMAEGIVRNGVTSFLPTTMTLPLPTLRKAFEGIQRLMDPARNPMGAQILGVNAEGPFINPVKKGAQAGDAIRPVDASFLKDYRDLIRLVTIAPEMPGNLAGIRDVVRDTGIRISMGHTNASFEEARAGFDAGIRQVTHLFNAMTPLNHRNPGAVGAALTDDRVAVELIADCFHVHPALFPLIIRQKGDQLILITDSTRAGGLADGEYTLGGQPIFVKGIECRLADGTIAGSVLKLNQAVQNMRIQAGVPLWQAVRMASLNPAVAIGVSSRKGSLAVGKDADFFLADDALSVRRTVILGKTVFEGGPIV